MLARDHSIILRTQQILEASMEALMQDFPLTLHHKKVLRQRAEPLRVE